LDKRVHKQTDKVLFVKVQNDGFNLGAQRRAVVDSHLPEATRLLRSWMVPPNAFEGDGVMVQAVVRAQIEESGDFNLSGERYVTTAQAATAYPLVALENLCVYVRGVTYSKEDEVDTDGLCVLRANNIDEKTNQLNFTDLKQVSKHLEFKDVQRLVAGDVLICAASGSAEHVGKVALCKSDTAFYFGGFMAALRATPVLLPNFLFQCLRTNSFRKHLEQSIAGASIHNLKASIVHSFRIPLPPLGVQHQIVTEIEGYQKVIDGARQVLDGYKPYIAIDPAWPTVRLDETCDVNPKKSQIEINDVMKPVSFVPMADLSERDMLFVAKEQRSIEDVFKQYTYFENEDVLLAKVTPCFENGKSGLARQLVGAIGFGSSEFYVLRANSGKVLPEWLYFHVTTDQFRKLGAAQMTGTGGLQRVPREFVAGWKIPLPDLETQRAIVAEIEAEQALVNANRELIRRMEAKVKAAIDRVWGAQDQK
jgi:type I restriction enzyme M protein